MTASSRHALLASASLLLAACGSSSTPPPSCDVAAQTGCGSGQACEPVTGGAPACFDPVVISGRVFNMETAAGVGGARVVALDVDGAPASAVAISSSSAPVGAYQLRVPARRTAGGTPSGSSVTLRADAQDFEPFPSGLRVSLPVALGGAVQSGGKWTVSSSLTDLGVFPLAVPRPGTIAGTVARPVSGAGVLVVAEETTTGAASTAVPDAAGAFRVFNLANGTYAVRGYAKGVQYLASPATVTLNGGAEPTVTLSLVAGAATATVTGNIGVVASGGLTDPKTSVILVLASTFDAARIRGDAPAGLRIGGINGPWTISGIPDGQYKVLAGFETDYLVRDPSSIGGTAVLEFQVVSGVPLGMDGVTSAADLGSFKVTKAVQLTAPLPGTGGACETLAPPPVDPAALPAGSCSTSVPPSIGWANYSSQDFYEVTVVDERGAVAWQAKVDKGAFGTVYGAAVGASGVQQEMRAPVGLVDGRAYQVRVAAKNNPKIAGGAEEILSTSEDLLGVFTKVLP